MNLNMVCCKPIFGLYMTKCFCAYYRVCEPQVRRPKPVMVSA